MSINPLQDVPAQITSAIKKASRATGTDFEYLLKTAERESGFEPNAKSSSSTATGLFQFIEDTWLRVIKKAGSELGLGKYSEHIVETREGGYRVADRAMRSEILNLRNNPDVAALVAGEFSRENAHYLNDKLGRPPTQGELYLAHFMGPGEAARLIHLADKKPNEKASAYFPKAAKANPSIFGAGGRARSLGQVYNVLVGKHAGNKVAANNSDATGGRPWQVEIQPAARIGQTLSFSVASAGSSQGAPRLGGIGTWGAIIQETGNVTAIGTAISQALTPKNAKPLFPDRIERLELMQRRLQPVVPTRISRVQFTPSDLSFMDHSLFTSPKRKE